MGGTFSRTKSSQPFCPKRRDNGDSQRVKRASAKRIRSEEENAQYWKLMGKQEFQHSNMLQEYERSKLNVAKS